MHERSCQSCLEGEPVAEARTGRLSRGVRYAAMFALLGSFSLLAGFEAARTTFPDAKLR